VVIRVIAIFRRQSDLWLRWWLIFNGWATTIIQVSIALSRLRRQDSLRLAFFVFLSAIMASLAGTTLLWRGTALDRIWDLNPTAYKQLAPLGGAVGILLLLLGAALAATGLGWFRRRLWGWRLAVVIIATQVLGDVVNCIRGDFLRGGTGVIITGTLLLFLLQSKVRAAFA
jgi:hypothetical protein